MPLPLDGCMPTSASGIRLGQATSQRGKRHLTASGLRLGNDQLGLIGCPLTRSAFDLLVSLALKIRKQSRRKRNLSNMKFTCKKNKKKRF